VSQCARPSAQARLAARSGIQARAGSWPLAVADGFTRRG
jgi:hypothetical protein